MGLVTVEQIIRARHLLENVIRQTPMEHAGNFPDSDGGQVYLKCENLQRTGSFKLRGAYTRLEGLSESERARGVVAASAGNHAQGVALAASLLGIKATVFMPIRVPLPKLTATKEYGAEVHLHGEALEETLAAAQLFAQETGAVFIHPFDHPDIIAGQGTLGLEILEQVPDVATVLVSTGGGGLLGGVAAAIKGVKPEVEVIGVQAEQMAAFPLSLAAGQPVRVANSQTMADGIAVSEPGPVSYAHVSSLADEIVTVSEESLSQAVLWCLERRKLVVEPAGAASVAALLQNHGAFTLPVVAILSGGNVDPLLLLQIIQHGMKANGRYLELRLRIPDRPGTLVAVLSCISELGANVLDVEHSRLSDTLALGEVELSLNLETRGLDHCEQVTSGLLRAGFTTFERRGLPTGRD
jgi:threonine dehydratase